MGCSAARLAPIPFPDTLLPMKKLDIIGKEPVPATYTLANLKAAETVAQGDLVDFFSRRVLHLDEHVPLRGKDGLTDAERNNAMLAWNATYGPAFRKLLETHPETILDYANGRLRPDDIFGMIQQLAQRESI